MKMLEKRNIESTLYLGIAKDEKGELIAHAWLRSGPFYVSGAEVMEQVYGCCEICQRSQRK